MFDYLVDRLDGETFDTYKEYEDTVKRTVDMAIQDLGRAERWACTTDLDVLNQIGVEIKELESED